MGGTQRLFPLLLRLGGYHVSRLAELCAGVNVEQKELELTNIMKSSETTTTGSFARIDIWQIIFVLLYCRPADRRMTVAHG